MLLVLLLTIIYIVSSQTECPSLSNEAEVTAIVTQKLGEVVRQSWSGEKGLGCWGVRGGKKGKEGWVLNKRGTKDDRVGEASASCCSFGCLNWTVRAWE